MLLLQPRHKSIQVLKQCHRESLSSSLSAAFLHTGSPSQAPRLNHLMVAPENPSFRCYQPNSPSETVPAKVLGLNLIGMNEVTCLSMNQSLQSEGDSALARHSPCCHDSHQLHLNHMDWEWRWVVWKRKTRLLVPECAGGINNRSSICDILANCSLLKFSLHSWYYPSKNYQLQTTATRINQIKQKKNFLESLW